MRPLAISRIISLTMLFNQLDLHRESRQRHYFCSCSSRDDNKHTAKGVDEICSCFGRLIETEDTIIYTHGIFRHNKMRASIHRLLQAEKACLGIKKSKHHIKRSATKLSSLVTKTRNGELETRQCIINPWATRLI